MDTVLWPEILDNRLVIFKAGFDKDGLFFDMSEKTTNTQNIFFFISDFSKFKIFEILLGEGVVIRMPWVENFSKNNKQVR